MQYARLALIIFMFMLCGLFTVGALWMWEMEGGKECAQKGLLTALLMAQHTQPVMFCISKRCLLQVCQTVSSISYQVNITKH
jgi:hypothetical protein